MLSTRIIRSFDSIVNSDVPALSKALYDMYEFWKAAGPERYFQQSDTFDQQIRHRYQAAYEAARQEKQVPAQDSAEEHLGMILLLDQVPRNIFRGSPRQYESDALARKWTDLSISRGMDRKLGDDMAQFFYLPLSHSEDIKDQNRAVQLGQVIGEPFLGFAKLHRDTVAQFGRFCHRNDLLGRESTPQEVDYLKNAPGWAKV